MNTFIYQKEDGIDLIETKVFMADQCLLELLDLMRDDPEGFHKTVGTGYDYESGAEYYLNLYMLDVNTVYFTQMLEDKESEAIHQEAKKVNFLYHQVEKLGVPVVHPQRPQISSRLACSHFDGCNVCPAGDGRMVGDITMCEEMVREDFRE